MLDDLRDAAANALPPPREDEPATLRQEILDELSDHFACAYRREILRTRGDAELSNRNIRQRFGDPGRIARKLWFDAMKGKLMAQKLMVFATCLSVVLMALVAFAGLRLVEASQRATSALIARSQETSAALIAQSEKTHAAILARLEAQNKNGEEDWSGSLEWSEFELKFMEEGTGEPVSDVTVVVRGPNENGQAADSYWQKFENQHPNASGVLELAPLHVGQYDVSIQTSWGATFNDTLSVRPGHDFQKGYRVPTKPEDGKVELKIQWPERLRGRDLWCVVGAVQDSSQVVDGMKCHAVYPRFFAVHTDGRMVDLAEFYGNLEQSDLESRGPSRLIAFNESVIAARQQLGAGLSDVREGRIAPWLLGLYTEPNLPKDANQLLYNMISLGFRQPSDYLQITEASSALALFHSPIDFRTFSSKGEIAQGSLNRIPSPGWTRIEPDQTNPWTIAYPPEAADLVPEDMLPPRTPVEAPKVSHYGRTLTIPAPTTLTIRCVDGSPKAVPVPNVKLVFNRTASPFTVSNANAQSLPVYSDGFQPPFTSEIEPSQTDANGICRIDNFVPSHYRIVVTLPDGTFSVIEDLKGFASKPDGTLEKTIVCPRTRRRFPVDLSISWPIAAKQRDDVWVILEIGEERRRHAHSVLWAASERHLVAIHPDGRMVTWTIDPEARGRSLYDLVDWPNKSQIVTYQGQVTTTTANEPQLPLWYTAEHRLLGLGIARWDGQGSPNQLLAGIRDGRYLPGEIRGHTTFKTREIFFHIFREIVPMKSNEGLPALELRAAGEKGLPTFFVNVPESLVQSALRRWDELPVASN